LGGEGESLPVERDKTEREGKNTRIRRGIAVEVDFSPSKVNEHVKGENACG